MADDKKHIYGVLAEFTDPAALLTAAEKVRDAGYHCFDCHSPFPIHGMDEAMGLKRSPLGWIVGLMALVGGCLGLLLQTWVHTTAYPLVIAGKPLFSYQAFVPITFGLAVLFGAVTAVVGMLVLNRLPHPWHPVFFSERFEKMTTNGFFISIEQKDQQFDAIKTIAFLNKIGAQNVELLEEEQSADDGIAHV
jgi:hypothetical protein